MRIHQEAFDVCNIDKDDGIGLGNKEGIGLGKDEGWLY